MADLPLPPPPFGLRAFASLTRRLPLGRWRAMRWVPSGAPAFVGRAPRALGGWRFACDLRDDIAREVFVTGAYAAQETALLKAILKPGAVFVDVGANWGYFSLLAAHLVGAAGRVVALEPHPALFRALEANLAANGPRRAKALAVAASESAGIVTLSGHDPKAGNRGTSSLLSRSEDDGERYEVRAARLDEVLDAEGVGDTDLVKIDVEGAEEMVLRGMEGLARHRHRRVLVELHPSLHPDGAALVRRVGDVLRAAGYRGWQVDFSASAARRAARRRFDARTLLTPIDASADVAPHAWPHQLWAAPGVEAVG